MIQIDLVFFVKGGKEYSINSRAVNAVITTNLSACVGGLSWTITNMIRRRSKLISVNGFCSGVISGLVAITPACGFISPVYALVFGLIGIYIHFFLLFLYLSRSVSFKNYLISLFVVYSLGEIF